MKERKKDLAKLRIKIDFVCIQFVDNKFEFQWSLAKIKVH